MSMYICLYIYVDYSNTLSPLFQAGEMNKEGKAQCSILHAMF